MHLTLIFSSNATGLTQFYLSMGECCHSMEYLPCYYCLQVIWQHVFLTLQKIKIIPKMSDRLTFHIHRYYIKILVTFFGFVSFTCCNCCLEKVYYLLPILILRRFFPLFLFQLKIFWNWMMKSWNIEIS